MVPDVERGRGPGGHKEVRGYRLVVVLYVGGVRTARVSVATHVLCDENRGCALYDGAV